MKILAIETTDQAGSVALLDGLQLVAERRLPSNPRSAQSLAPAVKNLLELHGWRPADVRLVGVALGPGSFTGLRVGVTTAKTFAFAVKCELVGVPTLDVIAAQSQRNDSSVDERSELVAVLDAGRQQIFVARYRLLGDGRVECVESIMLVDDAVWLAALAHPSSIGRRYSGPGLRKFAGRLPAGIDLAPTEVWAPQAATVGRLAFERYQAGERDDPFGLAPLYCRASAAEEKRIASDAAK